MPNIFNTTSAPTNGNCYTIIAPSSTHMLVRVYFLFMNVRERINKRICICVVQNDVSREKRFFIFHFSLSSHIHMCISICEDECFWCNRVQIFHCVATEMYTIVQCGIKWMKLVVANVREKIYHKEGAMLCYFIHTLANACFIYICICVVYIWWKFYILDILCAPPHRVKIFFLVAKYLL